MHIICRYSLIPVIFGTLAACSSGPSIFVNEDPGTDFSKYRTYNFQQPLGTDEQDYSSLLSQYLSAATGRELQMRGYEQADESDLLVNFYLKTQEKIQSSTTPSAAGGGYYRYRGYGAYSGYGTTTDITQYTEGTLSVDIVDRASNQLVWEGTAVGRITEKDLQNLEQRVSDVIQNILAKYPYYAQGFTPPPPETGSGS